MKTNGEFAAIATIDIKRTPPLAFAMACDSGRQTAAIRVCVVFRQ